MSTRLLAVAAVGATAVLTACGGPSYSVQPVEPTVLQQCTATYPDGTVEVVPDDYCIDHTSWPYGGVSYPPVWYYGGHTYHQGSRWYVRGGKTVRPVDVILTVRAPRNGGSSRAQGMTRSYNEQIRKRLGTTPTYQAKPVQGTVKSGDDRRGFNIGFGSKQGTRRSGGRR